MVNPIISKTHNVERTSRKPILWVLPFFSLLLAAGLCEWKGDVWEKQIRYGIYDVFRDSFPDFAPNFVDSRGIPVTYYPTQLGITPGYKYNGTIVAKYAIEYYQKLQQQDDPAVRKQFYHCIAWLDSAISEVNGHALYVFKWQQPWYPRVGNPFTSGMTSGRAIEAYTYAFLLDGDTNNLHQAARLVRGFALPIEEGGFTYKEPNGWWYEELADTAQQTPRILDGHIFALTGLYTYYAQTKDSLAKKYFDLGIQSLKTALPGFDRGDGYAYYDVQGKLADENYHPLLVDQMKDLWKITGDPVFKSYYLKWGKPLWEPYLVRIWKERNKSGWLLFLVITVAVWGIGFLTISMIGRRKKASIGEE